MLKGKYSIHQLMVTLLISGSMISSLLLGSPIASASTTRNQLHSIYINGKLFSNEYGFAAVDPSSGVKTTYFPIWYVMQALKDLGISNTWNGYSWRLSAPLGTNASSMPTRAPSSSAAQRNVYLDGRVVETPYAIVGRDPSSGVKTTYFPIWYTMQVLKGLGIQTSWDGNNWVINYSPGATQPSSPPAAVVLSSNADQIVANGSATDKITVTVTDANGTPLTSFSGVVDVSSTQNGVRGWTSSVPIANGMGNLTVTSGAETGTDILSTSDLQNGNTTIKNITYGAYNLLMTAPAPKVAVIMLMGLNSHLQGDIYNPTLHNPANWVTLNDYFDKGNQGTASNLLNSLISTGATILPFSYNGSTLISQNGNPSLDLRGYSASDVGNILPDTYAGNVPPDNAAQQLNLEVQSIQEVWPNTKIVIIGHSEGGLVAERYFMDYYLPSTAPEVDKIISLDSPINGVHGGAITSTLADLWPLTTFWLSGNLFSYYHGLWNGFATVGDAAIINRDSQYNNIYVPVGTRGDEVYRIPDDSNDSDGYSGILSQVLFDAPLQYGNNNHYASVDYVLSEPSDLGIIQSHHFVLESPQIISWLTSITNDAG